MRWQGIVDEERRRQVRFVDDDDDDERSTGILGLLLFRVRSAVGVRSKEENQS
jgi:hypothetical protein